MGTLNSFSTAMMVEGAGRRRSGSPARSSPHGSPSPRGPDTSSIFMQGRPPETATGWRGWPDVLRAPLAQGRLERESDSRILPGETIGSLLKKIARLPVAGLIGLASLEKMVGGGALEKQAASLGGSLTCLFVAWFLTVVGLRWFGEPPVRRCRCGNAFEARTDGSFCESRRMNQSTEPQIMVTGASARRKRCIPNAAGPFTVG